MMLFRQLVLVMVIAMMRMMRRRRSNGYELRSGVRLSSTAMQASRPSSWLVSISSMRWRKAQAPSTGPPHRRQGFEPLLAHGLVRRFRSKFRFWISEKL